MCNANGVHEKSFIHKSVNFLHPLGMSNDKKKCPQNEVKIWQKKTNNYGSECQSGEDESQGHVEKI